MTEPRVAGRPSKIGRGDLPDVNVWLALAATQHPHHDAAASYWAEHEGGQIWFCRITMLGLVRLLSNPKVMGAQALDLTQSMAAYQRFQASQIRLYDRAFRNLQSLQKITKTEDRT